MFLIDTVFDAENFESVPATGSKSGGVNETVSEQSQLGSLQASRFAWQQAGDGDFVEYNLQVFLFLNRRKKRPEVV